MTTKAAAAQYLAEHLAQIGDRPVAVYNPLDMAISELPIIYGFNNGGSRGWCSGVLVAEDGHYLGGHACSDEAYMLHDLGILHGCREDRHDTFKLHYPDGYIMEFVPFDSVKEHEGLQHALALNEELRGATQ